MLVSFSCSIVHAEDPVSVEKTPLICLSSKHANWIFSGSVTTETGDAFEYFFQVKRNDDQVQSVVSLVDEQSKAVIFTENAQMTLTADVPADDWKIGRTFIRYNPINRSWIFGLDNDNKLGFNFKVDMLNQPDHDPVLQQLRKGIRVVVAQTGQVNGSIQLKEDVTQFVTGKNAWFRQIEMTDANVQTPSLQGLLCRFQDGSGLYAMKLMEAAMVRGTNAGFYNAEGLPVSVSQFIHVEQKNAGPWKIRVPYPKLQFELSNTVQYPSLTLGFMSNKKQQGFCVISQEG